MFPVGRERVGEEVVLIGNLGEDLSLHCRSNDTIVAPASPSIVFAQYTSAKASAPTEQGEPEGRGGERGGPGGGSEAGRARGRSAGLMWSSTTERDYNSQKKRDCNGVCCMCTCRLGAVRYVIVRHSQHSVVYCGTVGAVRCGAA